MSNKGKFVDRNPSIRTAGKILQSDDNVGDSLRVYSLEEEATNIINMRRLKEIQTKSDTAKPDLSPENLKDLLSPESKKSRFVKFREKFSEDMFFRKAELGKVLPLQTKPDTFNNESFTYGLKRPKSEASYGLILPKKSEGEVNREYVQWHDKYIISHNHYFPSERIQRHYNEKFNPNAVFGIRNQVDTTGRMVRQCMQQSNPLVVINKNQKQFIDRTMGHLGNRILSDDERNLEPATNVDKKLHADNCDVRDLIEDIAPCSQNTSLSESLSHVNKLRRHLFNRTDFHMYDLKILLQKYDKESTGFLTMPSILKALRSLLIRVNEVKIRQVMSYFKILLDEGEATERVNWDLFWKMLHIQYPLPRTGNISVMPKNFYNKDTTYRLFCGDRDKPLECHPMQKSIHKSSDIDHIAAVDCKTTGISQHN